MITYIIIGATVLVSILCFRSAALFNALSLKPFRVFENREWWRVATHGFVHGDYAHLLVNMLVFWSFGGYIEKLFGHLHQIGEAGHGPINYLLLYFGGMLVATIPDLVRNRHNPLYTSIGASGAVSAVIFCSIFFDPWGKVYFFGVLPLPGIVFGAFYLWYEQYMARRGGDRVNHHAHIWGAVYGFLFPLLVNASFFGDFVQRLIPRWG